MPYIEQDRRDVYEEPINKILGNLYGRQARGELNYVIFSLIYRYLKVLGISYSNCNDFIHGVLDACKMELWWRILRPYEDEVAERNGDVLKRDAGLVS